MQLPVLRLNARADQRLRQGHLWIYSNEINNDITPLKQLESGAEAIIQNATGKMMGVGYVNPNALICARIISQNSGFDLSLLQQRINAALKLRQQLFVKDCYRLIYGESDLLPGLVVDRFFDLLVVQISTAGMERHIDSIVQILDELTSPQAIVLKNDGKMREVEGLLTYVEWKNGNQREDAELEENGVKFYAPVLQGQKTGWFYDHRMTRARLPAYVKDKRVLDVFSYVGGWGIQAAAFGAKEVVLTDSSAFALQYVDRNAQLNNLSSVSTLQGDAFEVMESLYNAGEKFDVVILDPPAFIPRRKDFAKGFAAYQKANLAALRLLPAEGGILISGSCSMHLQASDLRDVILKSCSKLGRQAQILEQGQQSPDHPIHLAIPETAYLKSYIVRTMGVL